MRGKRKVWSHRVDAIWKNKRVKLDAQRIRDNKRNLYAAVILQFVSYILTLAISVRGNFQKSCRG